MGSKWRENIIKWKVMEEMSSEHPFYFLKLFSFFLGSDFVVFACRGGCCPKHGLAVESPPALTFTSHLLNVFKAFHYFI